MKNNKFDYVKIKFEKFLSLIDNVLTCENEINIIQNKLRRHFNTATSNYLCSNEFLSALNHIQTKFVENNKSTKYFTLLASFDEQLKKHSIKLSKPSHSPFIATTISTNEIPTIEYVTSISEVQETIEYLLDQCCNILSEVNTPQAYSIDNTSDDSKRQRKINKLEQRLHKLSKIIRELEEKDMSLEEMATCNLYVVESELKKQAYEIHAKLAKLKSQSSSIERIIHQPITLNESETGHPLINEDLQEMVNQSKHFPSFTDVLNTVEKANEKYKLNFSEELRRNFAEKSFKIIGKEIKNRRMADFQDIMYSRLPEDFNIEQNDPALNSAEIEKALSENQREAVVKTERIFEEYSRYDPDPEDEIHIESTEEIQPYDPADTLPPLCTKSSFSANESLTPALPESDSIEPAFEIPLNNRTITILSTASLPEISKEEILTPRRKQNLNNNDLIYKLYTQRLTNGSLTEPKSMEKKRPFSKTTEYSNVKKPKQSEIIVLD